MQTSNPKIFAGGDCVNGGAEAVDASQMGKLAAQGIHFSFIWRKGRICGLVILTKAQSMGYTTEFDRKFFARH